jgi:hypothetical protein
MKTSNESYHNSHIATNIQETQNLTQTQRDLKIEKFYLIIEKAQLLELKGKISSIRFINLFNLYMNKITFLYSLPVIIDENEIQTIDNQIQVTQTQINRLTKLNFFATLLQKKSNKKSFYKYRQILLSIRNKIDLKQRVLNLLVWEKERLIKVA